MAPGRRVAGAQVTDVSSLAGTRASASKSVSVGCLMDSALLGSAASNGGASVAPPADHVISTAAGRGTDRAANQGGLALQLAFLGMATLGFNRTRVAGLALSDLLFMACGLVVVVKLLVGDTRDLAASAARRVSPLVLAGTIVLLTFGTVSSLRSWDPLGSMSVVLRFVWLTLVWFWILRLVARNRNALYRLLSGWRVAILTSSFFAVIGQLGIYEAGILHGEDRQMAFFFHPNELASLLVFGLPLIVFDVPRRPGQDPSTLRRVALTGFVVWAVMTTGSMTAFFTAIVGLTVGAIAIPMTRGRYRITSHTGFVSVGLGALAVIGLFFASDSELPVFQRFTRYEQGDSGIEDSVDQRADLNRAVIDHLDETLFVGTGLQLQGAQAGANVVRIGEGEPAPGVIEGVHNMFLKLVHEAGVPALIGLFIVIFATLRQTWRTAISSRGTDLYPVAIALVAAIVASNAMAQFGPIAYQRYYWTPIAMATCLWSIRRQELREEHAAQLETGTAVPPTMTTRLGNAWPSKD